MSSSQKERVVRITKSPKKGKKYRATVSNGTKLRSIDFGDLNYEHYHDNIGMFSRLNHRDTKRRRAYFMRHSGVSTKTKALEKEKRISKGRLNARILSHTYLW